MQRNSRPSTQKTSRLEKKVDLFVLSLFVIHAASCLFLSIGSVLSILSPTSLKILDGLDNNQGQQFLSFFPYFVLLNTLVPLALGICAEIARFSQSVLIMRDNDMMTDGLPMKVRSSNLNAELGQVEVWVTFISFFIFKNDNFVCSAAYFL